MRRSSLLISAVALVGLLELPTQQTIGALQPSAVDVVITEFDLPTDDALPGGIVVGLDGALWFHMSGANKIGRMTTDGQVSEFEIPTPNSSQPREGFLGVGTDGAVWFTESAAEANKLGRITMDGQITEYPIPTARSFPAGIAAGPDGAVWFTEAWGNKIGRISTDGEFLEFPIPSAVQVQTPFGEILTSFPLGIVSGPDGALWFTESRANRIGRVTADGVITEYEVPTPDSRPLRLAVGPDSALWFTEGATTANKLGRLMPDGQVTEYPVPSMGPGVTTGPDEAIWFTGFRSDEVGRLASDGTLATYRVPTEGAVPYHIVTGPDGALWFTERESGMIGRAELRPLAES
jgi:virginiamycin B lyase